MPPDPRDYASTPLAAATRPAAALGSLALRAARAGGQRPYLTFYDLDGGERTELGHATLHNWVSKAANLLADELELAPGDVLAVQLPTHWTTLVTLLAAWRAGLVVRLDGATETAAAAVVAEGEGVDAARAERTVVVGRGPGGRVLGEAGGALDFAQEVLACADDFDDPQVDADHPALEAGGIELTHGDLLDAAAATATALDLRAGTRVLSTHGLDGPDGLLAPLAALASGAAVVLVAGGDADAAGEVAATERCTLAVGPAAPGVHSADAPGVPHHRLALVFDGGRPVAVRAEPAPA